MIIHNPFNGNLWKNYLITAEEIIDGADSEDDHSEDGKNDQEMEEDRPKRSMELE